MTTNFWFLKKVTFALQYDIAMLYLNHAYFMTQYFPLF